MDKPDFIAFDVETATPDPASLCQIGYVAVSKGEIVFQEFHLVRPPNNEYASRNSCIHGIDALKTKDVPEFTAILNSIMLRGRNLDFRGNGVFGYDKSSYLTRSYKYIPNDMI
jgi:DNA polymerase-3 subunit epsilon